MTNDKNNLYWRVARKYNLEQILKKNPSLAIQGEQNDTKVQGNKYKFKEPQLHIFNIIDYKRNYFYNYNEIEDFCTKYNLKTVPFLFQGKLLDLGETVPEVVEYSKGLSSLANVLREGVVVRCVEDGKKIVSFKCINPDFLLKFD